MKVLGLSSNYHDASAALVIDGKVVAAAAEERFTLQKHDPSFPLHAANFCLQQAGISGDDLDIVAYHEEPEVKFSRTLSSAFVSFPHSRKTFLKSMHEAITSGFWIKNEISKALNVNPKNIIYVPHHFSHAAHAFISSPYENAAILTVDAVGEWTCTGLFYGETKDNQATINPIGVVPFPHSLGLIYSAFTAFLGFKVNDGECSTMALAAFGVPKYKNEVKQIIQQKEDGTYAVDISFFDFSQWEGVPIAQKFIDLFGKPRPFKEELPFDCLLDGKQNVLPEHQHYADIAASIQCVLEESVFNLAKKIKKETGAKNLCLSGGVALNCVANGRLIAEGIFENVFVPPDPGDGGGAMGAALYAHLAATGFRDRNFILHPYFGKEYDEQDIFSILPELNIKKNIRVVVRSDFDAVLAKIVPAIAEGKLVGWLQGRFENGPRALGNRSILCDPGNIAAARRLSARVKKRASFRPYACSIAEEDAGKIFSVLPAAGLYPAKWMQSSATVKQEMIPRLRAALHVDSSTRPQICSATDNPRYHRFLTEYGKHTGLAAILNTSFNESGMPIVSSPYDALLTFIRTDMDMLVLNNSLLVKE